MNGKTIVPKANLVTNIGFGMDSTHTNAGNSPLSNLPVYPMHFPLIHPEKSNINLEYDKLFLKHFDCSPIKNLFGKCWKAFIKGKVYIKKFMFQIGYKKRKML
jgi:hypothetical protein